MMGRRFNPFEGDYEIGEKLGEGGFGTVFKATSKEDGKIYAVKILKVEGDNFEKIIKEIDTQYFLNTHQSILMLHHHYYEEKRHCVYLVLDYCENGDLNKLIRERRQLNRPLLEEEARDFARQIIEGIAYIHSKGFMHRDLKLGNILVTSSEKHIKIADFGLSKALGRNESAKTVAGTPSFMSPQLMRGQEYTRKADVWSFGMILYNLLFGKLPPRIIKSIHMIPPGVSQEAADLIFECLRQKEEDRIDTINILTHGFFQGSKGRCQPSKSTDSGVLTSGHSRSGHRPKILQRGSSRERVPAPYLQPQENDNMQRRKFGFQQVQMPLPQQFQLPKAPLNEHVLNRQNRGSRNTYGSSGRSKSSERYCDRESSTKFVTSDCGSSYNRMNSLPSFNTRKKENHQRSRSSSRNPLRSKDLLHPPLSTFGLYKYRSKKKFEENAHYYYVMGDGKDAVYMRCKSGDSNAFVCQVSNDGQEVQIYKTLFQDRYEKEPPSLQDEYKSETCAYQNLPEKYVAFYNNLAKFVDMTRFRQNRIGTDYRSDPDNVESSATKNEEYKISFPTGESFIFYQNKVKIHWDEGLKTSKVSKVRLLGEKEVLSSDLPNGVKHLYLKAHEKKCCLQRNKNEKSCQNKENRQPSLRNNNGIVKEHEDGSRFEITGQVVFYVDSKGNRRKMDREKLDAFPPEILQKLNEWKSEEAQKSNSRNGPSGSHASR